VSERFTPSNPVIPIRAVSSGKALPADSKNLTANGLLLDTRGRRLHDLRISVTDRCNFRCTYCMPKSVFDKDYQYLPQSSLLSFEEIETLVNVFVEHGVEKIRLTGGEPLLRKNIERLIERLAKIKTVSDNLLDLTLTTNASLLPKKARSLRDAGLKRVTVSLDGLSDDVFRAMNDVDFPVADVLRGIEEADKVGLGPIKINMVVKKGVNDHEVLPMMRYFKGTKHILRFIEFMDVGASNGWKMDEVVSSGELVRLIGSEYPIEVIESNYVGEVAQRWRFSDGSGEVGFISSVTQPFCGDCSRARLSTDGKLYTCLFATDGYDLRTLLRSTPSSDVANTVSNAVGAIWRQRDDRYSEIRSQPEGQALKANRPKVEMSYIGG
jgi:GTP 3',8-cyclase